jgi:hypothetical protein
MFYKDHGISRARGRDRRPAFDALCRDATKRQFDMVVAWSVDRLGRSLQDLVAFLSELHALRVDLFWRSVGVGADSGSIIHSALVRKAGTDSRIGGFRDDSWSVPQDRTFIFPTEISFERRRPKYI